MAKVIQKLKSRKLWLAVAGIVYGVALSMGVDAGDIQTVAGAVVALASAVTYIIVEGKVDAEGVKQTVVAIQDAANTIGFKTEEEEE